ncbi:MAG: AsmA family protein [Solirubrobacterales bacterium]
MSLRRFVVILLSMVGALALAIVLYLAFGDLSRHKGRIEAFVTGKTGRPFAIDGAFELEVLPSVSVRAERVRLGNAEWGSAPQMVEVGRFSTEIGLWSLVSGPVDVRSLELGDVSVLLEKAKDGRENWVFGEATKPQEGQGDADSLDSGVTELPAVIRGGTLGAVRVTYRQPGKPDRVALLETLSIAPGTADLLAISGKGRIGRYATTLTGEVGPLDALFSGRDIRMALEAGIEKLRLGVKGGLGRLNPLDGADLTLKIEHPDVGTMLENLRLPVVATGPLSVDAHLKDKGELTQVDVDAKLGDGAANVNGTLLTLGLPGSDLRFSASVGDASRLASAFEVTGVPAEALEVGGHVVSSRKEIRLDSVNAKFAGAEAKVDGSIRAGRDRGAAITFAITALSLARLREGLPDIPFRASGSYTGSRDTQELRELKAVVGKSEISGSAKRSRKDPKGVEAEISSPRLDLTPFTTKEKEKEKEKQAEGIPAATAKTTAKEPKQKYVFGETPLPLDKLKGVDVKLHVVVTELALEAGLLKDVDGTLTVDQGQLALEWRASGGYDGSLGGAVKLQPAGDGAAELSVEVTATSLRAGLAAGEGVDPREVPPTSLELKLQARGSSPRQLAAGANGKVLLAMGPGKVRSGLVGALGAGILSQLASKLNPFSAKDPYTRLDCNVARVDIVDGQVKVEPVLMQSEKVTVTADGKVDLHTEELVFDFNTRPRKGIGVSPGMFTNPFLKLDGTLVSPRLGVGAKGAAAGGVAAATAGVSVVAKGLVDRIAGEADLCQSTLEKATRPPTPAKGQ